MKTLIAVPCFDMVHTDFMRSLIDLEKPEGTVYTVVKNTLIYNARNTIAGNAIKKGFDRVLFLDSDLDFPADTLKRLSADMDAGCEFVSGLYFQRRPNPKPIVYDQVQWEVLRDGNVQAGASWYFDYPKDTLFECQGFGFGCVMVSVDVLKKVADKYGAPFTPLMGLGEDLTFCYRARKLGAKLHCDSRIKCGHIGSVIFNEEDYNPKYWGEATGNY